MLSEETDKVKREVKENRKLGTEEVESVERLLAKLYNSPDAVAEGVESAKIIQQHIEQLPSTAQPILKQVKTLAGWNGSIFLGGPSPATGKMTSLIVHNSEMLNLHHTFPNATTLWNDIEKAWDKFITASFAADAAGKLHIAYTDHEHDGSTPPGSSNPSHASSPQSSSSRDPTPPPQLASDSGAAGDDASGSTQGSSSKPRPRPRRSPETNEATEDGNGLGASQPTDSPGTSGESGAELRSAQPNTVGAPTPRADSLAYERERLATIAQNRERLRALGIGEKTREPSNIEEPEWMSSALEYLEDIEIGETWDALLEVWAAFECVVGYPDGKKRLSAKGRPEEVARWISGGHQYDKVPMPDSLERYATSWCAWWTKLQPTARHTDAETMWPLPQVLPDNDMEWDALRRGGCNGIFIAIMGLAIWASALNQDGDDVNADLSEGVLDKDEDVDTPEVFLDAVDDVLWVLTTIIDTLPTGMKCPSADVNSDDVQPRKKRRTSKAAI
ncbi:hypothetical protein C8Q80DRAFT_1192071 [Daedaleopsis nitida]|nr:hypothetical protein C8Q80DRAFT_1192071 [Daedaleopsis nitida]